MKKILAVSAVIIIIAVIFASCAKKPSENAETSSQVSESYATLPALPTEQQTAFESVPQTSLQQTETETQQTVQPDPTQQQTENPTETQPVQTTAPAGNVTTTEKYQKTGTMHFSDSPDNKYLAAIVSKYNVDASLLAAIYTVPDANGNIVLRFNGTKDASGKLIRDESTLVCIYSINKDMVSKCASKDSTFNECDALETAGVFFSTTKFILPEFADELAGN